MKRRAPGMGQIVERRRGGYLVRFYVGAEAGRKVYVNQRAATLEKARHLLDAMKVQKNEKMLRPASKQTVAEWLREWLDQHIRPRCAAKTLDSYTHTVEARLIPALGSVRLTELAPRQVQAMLARWADEGLSGTTRREYLLVLHNALAAAVRLDVLRQNPTDRVEAPKREKRARRGLDTAQFFALVRAAEARDALMAHRKCPARCAFALRWLGLSGMRPGEASRLRVRDLDLKAGKALVRKSKTDAGVREVDLLPQLVLATQHVLDERGAQPDDLLLVHVDGKPVDLHNLGQRVLPDLLEAVGLPKDTRLYDLRHTYNVMAREAGVPMDVVQVNMGHAKISTTADVYGRVPVAYRQQGLKRLEEHLAQIRSQLNVNQAHGDVGDGRPASRRAGAES